MRVVHRVERLDIELVVSRWEKCPGDTVRTLATTCGRASAESIFELDAARSLLEPSRHPSESQ